MTVIYAYIKSRNEIPHILYNEGLLYIDTETYSGINGESALDTFNNRLRLVSVTGKHIVYIFDMMYLHPDWVFPLLQNIPLCGHNLSFDLPILKRYGLPFPPSCYDTMIASQVLMNGLDPAEHGGNSLQACMKRYLERDMNKDLATSDWSDPYLSPEQLQYAADDVLAVRDLHAELLKRTEKYKLTEVVELECSIIPAIVDMKTNGIAVDVVEWESRSRAAEASLVKYETEILAGLPLPPEMPMREERMTAKGVVNKNDLKHNLKVIDYNLTRKWNLASHVQIVEAFKYVGVNLPGTAYEVLIERRDDHPLINTLLEWKDKEKEATTFGLQWLKHVVNGRVHTDWRQLGCVSGRMSASSPNLQQIPRGECRKGFVASPGCVLVRADFSQIEARIAAKISGDPVMLELFNTGGDIHSYTARAVLQKQDITKEDRQTGKSLLFGLLFSMGAESLRQYVKINYGVKLSESESELFRERFFRTFTGLAKWHQKVKATCETKIEFRSILGRRRVVMGMDYGRFGIGLNHPVQGTAADLLKMSVREIWARRDEMPEARLVALIHDEIIMDTKEEAADKVASWLKGVMVEVGNYMLNPVPTDADLKIGKSWNG